MARAADDARGTSLSGLFGTFFCDATRFTTRKDEV
jgi:hypothetical protein